MPVVLLTGVRQDNRVMVRPPTWRLVTPQQRQVGAAFFMDDEDEFGLEQLLAASPAGGAALPQQ